LLLENLTKTYWKPIYCYLKKKGYANELAKDLTQSFFCEIILGRDLIGSADQAKGRFRNFLLVALERHVVSNLRHDGRLKRGGQTTFITLDAPELSNVGMDETMSTPEEAFYYSWVTELLDGVIEEVKQECHASQRQQHWEAFRLRLLEPIRGGGAPPPLPEICTQVGIAAPAKVSSMIETVKRRFRATLRRHLRELVDSDHEADEEFREIFSYLSRLGARFPQ
jgi:RNA polymerase sigma-70 factor (ECF subfamily)